MISAGMLLKIVATLLLGLVAWTVNAQKAEFKGYIKMLQDAIVELKNKIEGMVTAREYERQLKADAQERQSIRIDIHNHEERLNELTKVVHKEKGEER
jgi:Tfp pilus assembly protein PilN